MTDQGISPLGAYLRDRRAKIDASALGFSARRRRTPGLRREEVAQRANISPTWYTCLEQGRGGLPSANVLDRIARALLLTNVEREHLFLLGLGRTPQVSQPADQVVPSSLQRVLDALSPSPAFIRTGLWDVVAWNTAARMIVDFDALPRDERNLLRRMFLDPNIRASHDDWESAARVIVGIFRRDAARAGVGTQANELAKRLAEESAEFAALWHENDVHDYQPGVKHLEYAGLGRRSFEYTMFTVDGRPDLNMVVFCPIEDA